MPQTNSIAGLEYFETNSSGHIMLCSFASAAFDTTTLTYGVGCRATDRSTGDVYSNTGTSASPIWTKQPKKGSSITQSFIGAITVSALGVCPAGFSGTITGVRVVNGNAQLACVAFSKNGTNFAVVSLAATLGLVVGCPLGSATAGNNVCPLGSVTFGPSDVINASNSYTGAVEIVVDFV